MLYKEIKRDAGNELAYATHYWTHQEDDVANYFEEETAKYLANPKSLITEDPNDQLYLDFVNREIPFPPPENPTFDFIDLFAGIGGFRMAFQNLGGRAVFSSEWDYFAKRTYYANFGQVPFGDIKDFTGSTKSDEFIDQNIPNHDLLCAGFPCQPFSIAGVSKKNSLGKQHGFLDKTQGTLFFDIARILDVKRPRTFILENVKNLRSHDKGKTFKTIMETLRELGYHVFAEVVDAKFYVPQHRERIFLVGFSKKHYPEVDFSFPETGEVRNGLLSVLDPTVPSRYTLTDNLWRYLQDYAQRHRAQGNGFGFGLADFQGVTRTLSARYYKDGSEILIDQGPKRNPRRLSPNECRRLMGYPDNFMIDDIGVSETQLYKQFGNSVVVPVVQDIGEQLIPYLT